MVVVGLELTGFITGVAGKVAPLEVSVLEVVEFKVGVFTWHNAEMTNCPSRTVTRRNLCSNFMVVFSFVAPVDV